MQEDLTESLRAQIVDSAAARRPLAIIGGGSKAFLGRASPGEPLRLLGHRGIVTYEPRELVLSARAGTPLQEVEATLAERGQALPFEPPHFGADATLGGTIACSLSGPRRPYAGAARDFVLGVRILNGKGEVLRFGGEVMKNVAGYDLSRLMTGAMGTLGVLLEVSMKVLPRPPFTVTLVEEATPAQAIDRMNQRAGQPFPLTATAWHDGRLYTRLEGAEPACLAAAKKLGGVPLEGDFWPSLREQQHPFFLDPRPLWRLSVPPGCAPFALPGTWLLEWGGALRWLKSEAPADAIREASAKAGGHATLFRGGDGSVEPFHPLSAGLRALHLRLKAAFDPHGILNPGRMYPDW